MERRNVGGTTKSTRNVTLFADGSPPLRSQQKVIDQDDHDCKSRKRIATFRVMARNFVAHERISKMVTERSSLRIALISFIMLVAVSSVLSKSREHLPNNTYASSDRLPFPLIGPKRILLNVDGVTVMMNAGYKARPRAIGYYFRDSSSESFMGVQLLDPKLIGRSSHAEIGLTKEEVDARAHLGDSKDYTFNLRDELEIGDCVAQYEWQKMSYPTCNDIHGFDFTELRPSPTKQIKVQLVGNGYWRDVWVVRDTYNYPYAFKTMRINHDWADRNYDRHRRDALASERLTSSKNIVDIYGFCGNSGVFEYADGGNIETMLWYSKDHWNATERLIVAHQVAIAIAEVHGFPDDDHPSIAHTDISTSQFIFINGRYKLNDFNRCRFIAKNKITNDLCGFNVESNPGTFRSPEEYRYEIETEKIDIYSMGNIFYCLVTELWPFEDEKEKEAQRKVMDGVRPHIPSKFLNTTEYQVLVKAMKMCWRANYKERPSAKEVASFIETELRAMGVHSD